jgi:VanZ family protein
MAPMGRRSTAWLAVAIWALLVLELGSESFSQASTSRFLAPLLRWLLPALSADGLTLLEHAIRKTAHLVEYALLAALGYRALRLSTGFGLAAQLLLVTALVAGVASLDETLQAGRPSRGGHPGDVLLDVAGGLLGLAVAVALSRHPRLGRWLPPRRAPGAS